MSCPLIILGTGGGAHDLLDVVEASNAVRRRWEPVGFLDDAREAGSTYLGLEVLGGLDQAGRFRHCHFINAIGSDKSFRSRAAIVAATGLPPERFATLVHPGASVSSRARLGWGVAVHFGASVGGGAVIGDQVTLGPGCLVGHDCVVEDHAILAPGAVVSGFVRVGANAYIGAGSVVRQQVAVGRRSLVGMGAVVLRDVEPGSVVVGNPARPRPSSAPRLIEGMP